MTDEILLTLTDSGVQIVGKILGNEKSKRILICSHGFGVDSDSAGMFSVISEMYKDDFLTVRFHYVSSDQYTGNTFVHPFSIQLSKLVSVIEKLQERYSDSKITIIGHSQGCFIPAMYLDDAHDNSIESVILLAPPTTTNLVKKMTEYFSKREGSKIDFNETSTLTRSQGNITFVPKEFWNEAFDFNPLPIYRNLDENYETHFVRATEDTILDESEYKNLLDISPKSVHDLKNDHNFQDDKMIGLLSLLNRLLLP